MAPATVLTPGQAHALLDILTHRETYTAEIELFKTPGIIKAYGPPFEPDSTVSKSPILQTLFSTFIVPVPGLRDVEEDFWTKRALPLIDDLAKANLSESYDKGSMGIRKTLATAISALIEYPARGVLGGMPGKDTEYDPDRSYDVKHQQDLSDAWKEFMRQAVYGDLLDELFDKAAESDKLEGHSQMVIAAHQNIVVNLASLVHYVLITSPKGQTLLSLIERTHKLIPYRIIRQTLKVGNAATMISGMTRLILAKMSIGALANWIGLSTGADEGMNLLQTIMYTVMSWDMKELEARVAKFEKTENGPSKEQLEAVKAYTKLPREEQEQRREVSKASATSIIHAILSTAPDSPSTDLTSEQHKLLLEYLSALLSIHDREQLILVICKSNPDYITAGIRDVVGVYDPILRELHNAVDLSATIADFERFLNDLIKTAKVTAENADKPPGVEEFVALFERHQKSCHVFLHQFFKKGGKATELWRDYAKYATKQFQRKEGDTADGAGSFTPALNKMVNELSAEDQKVVMKQMDEYEEYLQKLSQKTNRRMASIVAVSDDQNGERKPMKRGPGNFLFKWQDLLDSTEITPSEATGGKVRSGKDHDVKAASRVDVNAEKKEVNGEKKEVNGESDKTTNGTVDETANGTANETANGTANGTVNGIADGMTNGVAKEMANGVEKIKEAVELPDVKKTVELLLPRFKEVLAGKEY
ncbi:hypothetical protein ABW20_dc0110133 [Dactylellina cionopaga]|nr:hypothetical protein ABW20_dc0110133 [Dactylellina cionopaga]